MSPRTRQKHVTSPVYKGFGQRHLIELIGTPAAPRHLIESMPAQGAFHAKSLDLPRHFANPSRQ